MKFNTGLALILATSMLATTEPANSQCLTCRPQPRSSAPIPDLISTSSLNPPKKTTIWHPRGYVEVDKQRTPFLHWYVNGYGSSTHLPKENNPCAYQPSQLSCLPTAPNPNLVTRNQFFYENGIVHTENNIPVEIHFPKGATTRAPNKPYKPHEIIKTTHFTNPNGIQEVIRFIAPPIDARNPKSYNPSQLKDLPTKF